MSRRIFICLFLLGLFSFTLQNAEAAVKTYRIDPTHTAITWHVNHFGFSTPSGKFMNVEGMLFLNAGNLAASSVSLNIKVEDGKSGVSSLDEVLNGPDFFDTKKFPIATFVSRKFEQGEKNMFKVTGDLSLHGVTKSIVIDMTLNKLGKNFMLVETAGFSGTTSIKRSDFGMTAYLPELGDEVKLDIQCEANIYHRPN